MGAGVGAGVLVSRYFGAREYGKMKTIVSTSLLSFFVLSIILGVFSFGFSHAMMSGLQTPADILEEAVLYLRVYFAGFPFLFMYNILSTMFTSIGESKIPLGLLIFSSVLNILMDLWMVAGLGLGVFGAALATLIAQGISAVLSLLLFLRRMRRYKSAFHRFDGQELCSMLQIAVPSVLQQSTVSIGMMLVQAVVNPFGFAEPWRREKTAHQKRLSCRTAAGCMLRSPCLSRHRNAAHADFLAVPRKRRNRAGLSGVRGLHEMARFLLYLYGHQDGDRRRSSRTRNHAPVPRRKHGQSRDPSVRCPDLRAAFRHCVCLARCPGRLARQLFNLLRSTPKILAG